MHMVQHILLLMVAPLGILLANPFAAVVWGLPAGIRERFAGLFREGAPVRSALSGLTFMPVAWTLYRGQSLGLAPPRAVSGGAASLVAPRPRALAVLRHRRALLVAHRQRGAVVPARAPAGVKNRVPVGRDASEHPSRHGDLPARADPVPVLRRRSRPWGAEPHPGSGSGRRHHVGQRAHVHHPHSGAGGPQAHCRGRRGERRSGDGGLARDRGAPPHSLWTHERHLGCLVPHPSCAPCFWAPPETIVSRSSASWSRKVWWNLRLHHRGRDRESCRLHVVPRQGGGAEFLGHVVPPLPSGDARMERLYQEFRGRGLEIVASTSWNRGSWCRRSPRNRS